MALTPEKIADIEERLKTAGLIEADDKVVECEKGDYWAKLFLFMYDQVRGYYYFTEKAIVFVGSFGVASWSIRYKCIKEMKKCTVGLFLPIGLLLTIYDEKKGKDVSYKVAIVHKKKWMEYLEQKMK